MEDTIENQPVTEAEVVSEMRKAERVLDAVFSQLPKDKVDTVKAIMNAMREAKIAYDISLDASKSSATRTNSAAVHAYYFKDNFKYARMRLGLNEYDAIAKMQQTCDWLERHGVRINITIRNEDGSVSLKPVAGVVRDMDFMCRTHQQMIGGKEGGGNAPSCASKSPDDKTVVPKRSATQGVLDGFVMGRDN